jgi:two-component system sensor histidine kinase KdpD
VDAHGGTICVQDNAPHGAVFRFTLPLRDVPLREA